MHKSKKILHLIVIILGIIFISIPIFHQNLWFDESYSVALAKNTFTDIWTIGSNDVHPVLYYFGLHIIYLLFGSNLYMYRIFSMIPIAILGILGYTHIRKDFGEKEGLLFSLFTFFLPISVAYSGEIRMYTWAMLFVTIMSIYAYRIYSQTKLENKEDFGKKTKIKNWILFAIFSLASAYTHYYGLVTAGVVNLILIIYLIVIAKKRHKQNKENKLYDSNLKCFTISAIAQIILYLPWLIYFIKQYGTVAQGFWIQTPSWEIWLQIFIFQFTGDLGTNFLPELLAIVFSCGLFFYTIYSIIRLMKLKKQDNKQNDKPGILAIGVYLIVLLIVFLVSLKTPIFYARYFLNLTGLFMFFMAFFIAKGGRKILTVLFCTFTIIVAVIVNINITKMNYDASNKEPLSYIQKELQEGDIILFSNDGYNFSSGFVMKVQLTELPSYYYDKLSWNKEEAYQAFGKDMITIKNLDSLSNYQGRMWVIDTTNYDIYQELTQKYEENIKLLKQEKFYTTYYNIEYAISLIEKK